MCIRDSARKGMNSSMRIIEESPSHALPTVSFRIYYSKESASTPKKIFEKIEEVSKKEEDLQ